MNVSQRVGSGFFKDLCGRYFRYPHTCICGETAFSVSDQEPSLGPIGVLTETPAEPLDVEFFKWLCC